MGRIADLRLVIGFPTPAACPYNGGMRPLLSSVVIVVSLGTGTWAQLPPATQTQGIQQKVESLAQKTLEEFAMLAKRTTGFLDPAAGLAFRRTGEAVRLWKKEKGAGAAPLLSEGILLDCLGRLEGVTMRPLLNEFGADEEDHQPWGLPNAAATRRKGAIKAFDAALKIDPRLVEARMRGARLRAPNDSRAALELEELAQQQAAAPFAYLAAISRAAVAETRRDVVGAIHWYERALTLNPRSTAAAIALSALKPAAALPFEGLDPSDVYYTYPCTVLTPGVSAALDDRVQKVVLK